MKGKGLIFLIAICLFVLPLVSAKIYPYNSTLDLKVPCFNNGTFCSDVSVCNISIMYPNGTAMITGKGMTNIGTYHNYTIPASQTLITGEYSASVSCTDTTQNGYSVFNYEITLNGKPDPTSGTIVFFCLLYLFIVAFMVYAMTASLAHFIHLDMNLLDLVIVWSSYFVLLAVFIISQQYLNNLIIQNFFEWLVKVTAFTNVVVPGFCFVICMIKRNLESKQENPYG